MSIPNQVRNCQKVQQVESLAGPDSYANEMVSAQRRHLTKNLSFINKNVPTFYRGKRELFVKVYGHEYEGDYSNKLGPGPAAYNQDQTKKMKSTSVSSK